MRYVLLRVNLALGLLLAPLSVMATSTIFNAFKARYPNNPLTTSLSCNICHVGSYRDKTHLRPYALALQVKKNGGLSWTASFPAIEGMDSDLDGFSNLIEILAGKDPSDATQHPVHSAAAPAWSLYE